MRASVIATRFAIVVGLGLAGAQLAHAQQSSHGDDESAALVAAGRAALTAGDLSAAAQALDQALALNPRRVETYALRAAVYAARGEPARGVALMRRARELAPGSDDVLTALGTQLVLAGAVDEGVPLLEAVVGRAPDRYEAHALLGHYYADHERWPAAVASLEAYRRSRPPGLAKEDDRNALDLAEGYLRVRRAPEARALYRGLSQRHPSWLTARMGLAWSTAAIDCRAARPLLAALEAEPTAPPEVWLVDGQCALELGAVKDALRQAHRYLDSADRATAAGYALLGEAEAARGDLRAARAALTQARTLEPSRRRYAIRLARVLRLAKDPAGALAELDQLGPPTPIDSDVGYWIERGEALLESGRAAAVVTELAPVVAAVPDDAALRTVIGDAALATGDAPAAVGHLEAALAVGGATPRASQRLSAALLVIGTRAIAADQLPAAEQALARADAVQGTPAVGRAYGVVLLATSRFDAAAAILTRAVEGEPEPVGLMLLGRAQAMRKDSAAARAAFDAAVPLARGPLVVELAIERAAFELEAGQPAAAVAALVEVPAPARTAGGAGFEAALVTARHAAGIDALGAGQAQKAFGFLEDAARDASGEQAIAIRCDLALAAVATGDRERATAKLKAIAKLRCPFPAPADTQAVPILTAFVDGLVPRRAARAVDKLTVLERNASGPTKQLAATAVRVVAMTAADQAYRAGQTEAAKKFLATAKKAESRAGADELAYDQAAVELAQGDLASAKAGFQRVLTRVPEAYLGLGIAADREGDGARALELWRAAKKAGVRFAALDEWIAAKERIFGGRAP